MFLVCADDYGKEGLDGSEKQYSVNGAEVGTRCASCRVVGGMV